MPSLYCTKALPSPTFAPQRVASITSLPLLLSQLEQQQQWPTHRQDNTSAPVLAVNNRFKRSNSPGPHCLLLLLLHSTGLAASSRLREGEGGAVGWEWRLDGGGRGWCSCFVSWWGCSYCGTEKEQQQEASKSNYLARCSRSLLLSLRRRLKLRAAVVVVSTYRSNQSLHPSSPSQPRPNSFQSFPLPTTPLSSSRPQLLNCPHVKKSCSSPLKIGGGLGASTCFMWVAALLVSAPRAPRWERESRAHAC